MSESQLPECLSDNHVMLMDEDHYSEPCGASNRKSAAQIRALIKECQKAILSAPSGSATRQQQIDYLVELQECLSNAIEQETFNDNVEDGILLVLGHKFKERKQSKSKRYCECCATFIWNMIQMSYRCLECGISLHEKCIQSFVRACPSTQLTTYIFDICPKKGLDEQKFLCAECRAPLSYHDQQLQPRVCDYSGLYYCAICHWTDTMVIPARVLANWDFEERKVCRASKHQLKLLATRPLICISDINPMLLSLVDELKEIKRLREEIITMKSYILDCKVALKSKLLLLLRSRPHFVDGTDAFSLQDLIDTNSEILLPWLAKVSVQMLNNESFLFYILRRLSVVNVM